ncbi:MAG: UDP-N-acetylmuramoyl-L-alanine--D-glutamate ligase, partial [Tardiphaga sp.]
GEAANDFSRTLEGKVPFDISVTLDAAVANAARDATEAGLAAPVVLLSPACASFDQFRNFEIRGDRFRELVLALDGVKKV